MGYLKKFCSFDQSIQLKNLDVAHRKVDITVSAFNIKDSDGDIIIPTAFNRTLKQRGPLSGKNRIKHLLQHDPHQLIGGPESMSVTGTGLDALSVLSGKDNADAAKALANYENDLYEHSIGFEIIEQEYSKNDKANIIKEIALWEYSAVTWGANEHTPLNGIKTLIKESPARAFEKLNERINKLIKAIRSGEYTDEVYIAWELELKQIQQFNQDLFSELSSAKSDDTPQEDTFDEAALTQIIQNSFTQKVLL